MAACDKDQLISFLEANPDKAAAWAAVQGIDPSAIRAFIGADSDEIDFRIQRLASVRLDGEPAQTRRLHQHRRQQQRQYQRFA